MKENFKVSASLFGTIIVAGIMCSMFSFSMKMIFNTVFTETIGYQVAGTIGDSQEKEYLYTYIYEDGDTTGENDTKWAEYEEKGYTLYKYAERNTLSKNANLTMIIITQIGCFLSVGGFVHSVLNKRGYKDGALVRSGNKKDDKFRGLKIGLMASVPAFLSFVAYLILWASNKSIPVAFYMIYNACFWPILELVFASTKSAKDIVFWQFVVMFLLQMVVPVLSQLLYYMGYKDYQISGKLIYKKKG